MKWIRVTDKECDMLYFVIKDWETNTLFPNSTDNEHYSTGRNMFTVKEMRDLREKVEIAYRDKDSSD